MAISLSQKPCPHPLTPSPKMGEGGLESFLLPSPTLGEGLGVRAFKISKILKMLLAVSAWEVGNTGCGVEILVFNL
jgi:hypothetical protein